MKYTIYCLTFHSSGKQYVGFTADLHHRVAVHLCKGVLPVEEGFDVEVIAVTEDKAEAEEIERNEIVQKNTLHPEGYNLQSGGTLGAKHHPETKTKISAKSFGHQRWLGKKHTEETKALMSQLRKALGAQGRWGGKPGRILSEEAKAKISKANTGRQAWNKGVARTEEERAKMSASLKGRKSPMKGKSWSSEVRAKISAGVKGFKHTEEAKKKMRKGASGRSSKGWETRRANAAARAEQLPPPS